MRRDVAVEEVVLQSRIERRRAALDSVRARHPRFVEALIADARTTAAYRGERFEFRSRLDALVQAVRLMWVSDAFLAQTAYRAKARLQALRVPVLPMVAHRLAMVVAQVSIGDHVVVEPGLYLAHGQVVIDGFVELGPGVVVFPWVTIGLRPPDLTGPVVEAFAQIGTGAKVLGPVTIGVGARVGANAVVLDDVPADATAVGVPAVTRSA